MLAEGDFISERELSGSFWSSSPGALGGPAFASQRPEVDRERLLSALEQSGGNKAVAARLVGLSRRAFYRRLEQFGLHDPASREESEAGE